MINLDGRILNESEAKLSVENRGYHYGDALFETMRAINGIVFWEDHYFRLMASMRILKMEIPMEFSPEFLEKEITNLIQANGLTGKPTKIKLNIHRKGAGLYKPESREIGYLIRAWELDSSFYILNGENYNVELFKDHFVNSGLLSTLKTNNKIIHVLGSIYAEENGYSNCLLLNETKSVTEALNGNLFLVQGNTIKTPPLSDGCLNGIIRKKVLEILRKLPEYLVKEAAISPFELQKADELFVTNTISGIQPISSYRKKNFENKIARDLLGKLNAVARLG